MLKSSSELVGKILFWNFKTNQWENEATSMEEFVFEEYYNQAKLDAFDAIAMRENSLIATLVEGDDFETEDEEIVDFYLNKGHHVVNRFGYLVYKLAEGVTEDPLDGPETEYYW